jgi:hypothetical protein
MHVIWIEMLVSLSPGLLLARKQVYNKVSTSKVSKLGASLTHVILASYPLFL